MVVFEVFSLQLSKIKRTVKHKVRRLLWITGHNDCVDLRSVVIIHRLGVSRHHSIGELTQIVLSHPGDFFFLNSSGVYIVDSIRIGVEREGYGLTHSLLTNFLLGATKTLCAYGIDEFHSVFDDCWVVRFPVIEIFIPSTVIFGLEG